MVCLYRFSEFLDLRQISGRPNVNVGNERVTTKQQLCASLMNICLPDENDAIFINFSSEYLILGNLSVMCTVNKCVHHSVYCLPTRSV